MTAPAARSRATSLASVVGDVWAKGAAPRFRGQPADVDDVLDPDRDAVERPERPAGRGVLVPGACLGARAVGVDGHPRPEVVVGGRDPRERRLDDGLRGRRTVADRRDGLPHAEARQTAYVARHAGFIHPPQSRSAGRRGAARLG